MNASRSLFALLLCSLSLPLVACASPSDDDAAADDATQEDDIKKKVKPKGGNGAFDLVAPTAFKTDGFAGSFTFDNLAIKGGERREKVPGTYLLRTTAASFAEGQTFPQQLSFTFGAGEVKSSKIGGLRVRFDKPLTLGSARVDLVVDGLGSGFLEGNRTWQAAATGASLVAIAGKVGITPSTEGVRSDVDISEGQLKEVVLPIATTKLQLDAYDADYPTPTNCAATYVRAGAVYTTDLRSTTPVRKPDGSPTADLVVPQGTRAPVVLNAYGIETSQPTVAGGTNKFLLNRLEIDDVEIAQAGGGTTLVRGTVSISRKNANGTLTALNCTFPTHTGVDLPDGDYVVVSRANTSSGTVTSTEEVSFP